MNPEKAWDEIYANSGDYHSPIENAERASKFFEDEAVEINRVLDIGCGSGRHLEYLKEEGYEVYGVDLSEKALDKAKTILGKEYQERLIKADIFDQLPFDNDFFDAAVSFRVINHSTRDRIQNVIHEMERVLKPGGKAYITVSRPRNSSEEIPDVEKVGERAFKNLEGEEKGVTHFLFNEELIREMFTRNAGFRLQELKVDDEGYYRICLETK